MCHADREELTTEYTDEQKAVLISALEDIHGNAHPTRKLTHRCYLVMAFTEYEDGISTSMGAFGSKGIDFSGDKVEVARKFIETDLATISCSLASKELNEQLEGFADTAQALKIGAIGFVEAIDKEVAKALAAAKQDTEEAIDCAICGASIRAKDSHNPAPVKTGDNDRCCESCNGTVVIPARIKAIAVVEEA